MLSILCETLLILNARIESIRNEPNTQLNDENHEILIKIYEILKKIENKISIKREELR